MNRSTSVFTCFVIVWHVGQVEHFIQFQYELEQLVALVRMLPVVNGSSEGAGLSPTVTPAASNNSLPEDAGENVPKGSRFLQTGKSWKPSLLRIWDFMQSAVCGQRANRSGSDSSESSAGGGGNFKGVDEV